MPRSQNLNDVRNIGEHPIASSFAVRSAALALHHPLAFKYGHAEFGPADVDS
jgi:hypothetical protein